MPAQGMRGTNKAATVLGVARPPFLLLVPLCVAPGVVAAHGAGAHVSLAPLLLVLLGALAAHVSVNALNEYADFTSGLDLHTTRTPFSGGSGTLPANPAHAPLARLTGWVALAISLLVGLYFCLSAGWGILWAGGLGALMVAAYSPVLVRHPFLCLLAPGLGFGPAMVLGTQYALAGRYTADGLWLSVPVLALVSALLLANQIPDRAADMQFGRKNIVTRYGIPVALMVNTGLWLAGIGTALFWAVHANIFKSVAFALLPALLLAGLSFAATRKQDIDYKKVLGLHTAAVLLALAGFAVSTLQTLYFQ